MRGREERCGDESREKGGAGILHKRAKCKIGKEDQGDDREGDGGVHSVDQDLGGLVAHLGPGNARRDEVEEGAKEVQVLPCHRGNLGHHDEFRAPNCDFVRMQAKTE